MPYFIDTNIFIRLLVKDDLKKFKDCLKLLELVKGRKIDAVTSSLVKSEIEWVLRSFYKISKQDIVKHIEYIENLGGLISLNMIWDRRAIVLYKEFPVKFIDAQIASIPELRKREWIIVSYDRDFDKLAVNRAEPAEIVKNYKI